MTARLNLPPVAGTRAQPPSDTTPGMAADTGIVARTGQPTMSIPYLQPGALVVIVGPRAYEAIASLRAIADTDGVRSIDFGACAFVDPKLFAAITKETARIAGSVVFTAPLPNAWTATIDAADLLVLAPENVGNRVWFVVAGDAFSVVLPEIADQQSAAGPVPRPTHRASPTVH